MPTATADTPVQQPAQAKQPAVDAKAVISKYNLLVQQRSTREADWDEAIRYMMPRRIDATGTTTVSEATKAVFDDTAIIANNTLAAGLVSTITPATERWAALESPAAFRDETPDECLLREAQEETGLTLTDWRCRGVVTFLSDEWEGEYMYLFTASGFTGTLRECDEGDLEWVDKTAVPSLPLWAGDRIFFRLLAEDAPFFLLKLRYEGDTLVEAALNGAPVSL